MKSLVLIFRPFFTFNQANKTQGFPPFCLVCFHTRSLNQRQLRDAMRAGFHDDITATAAPHLERNNGSASQLPPPPLGGNQTPPKTAGNFTLTPSRLQQRRCVEHNNAAGGGGARVLHLC